MRMRKRGTKRGIAGERGKIGRLKLRERKKDLRRSVCRNLKRKEDVVVEI